MQITENTVCLWFVPFEDQDWMAQLDQTDDEFKLTYRHRYYRDDKAHDSDDVKHWYNVTFSKQRYDLHTAIAIVDWMATGAKEKFGGLEVHKLMKLGKTKEDFMEEFLSQPWVHAKTETMQ